MPRTELLPDAVWARLDPKSARLGSQTRRRMVLGAVVAAVAVLLAVLAWLAGVIGSPLNVTPNGGSYRLGTLRFTESLSLENGRWSTQRIDAIEVGVPYARLVRSRGGGTSLAHGATEQISVTVRITDCSLARHAGVPIVLRVHGWWGERTLSVAARESQLMIRDLCRHS